MRHMLIHREIRIIHLSPFPPCALPVHHATSSTISNDDSVDPIYITLLPLCICSDEDARSVARLTTLLLDPTAILSYTRLTQLFLIVVGIARERLCWSSTQSEEVEIRSRGSEEASRTCSVV